MNDLFFTLLLYNKAKERRYKFYNCLVAHDEAYIDLNRYVEPTDTLTVTYKVMDNDFHNVNTSYYDSASQTWSSALRPTYICSARYIGNETNSIQVQFVDEYEGGVDAATGRPPFADNPIRAQIIINGATYQFTSNSIGFYNYRNGNVSENEYRSPFDRKIVTTLKTASIDRYFVNEEQLFTSTHTASPRRLTEGQGRALLKLFAGFAFHNGQLQTNRSVARIYSFYVQNANDEYTMRLQPAEDLDTGELGMYDSINDVFYPNKNSAGYFTVEENITDKIVLDVESQIDTRKWQILFTSNNMPFQLSNGQLCAVPVSYSTPPLFANPNGTPATDGDFIDAWIRMGLSSDEVGLFNNTVLNRNQNSDVKYVNNGDGSVTAKVGEDESPDGDYTRYAYQLNDIALSMVLIGNFEDIEYSDNSGFIIVTRPVGSNLNGGFRWRDIKSGRKAKNFLKDGESAGAQDIFFDTETSAVWAATGSTHQTEGDTLIGVMDNRPMGLRIYGMALYRGIHTTAELLQVAEWLDSLTKRPVQTREITSES